MTSSTLNFAGFCRGGNSLNVTMNPPTAADRIRSWGVDILDVLAAAADVCATAYRKYRKRGMSKTDTAVPVMPLPDFFIGAHAKIMGWELATADRGRFHTYFPSVSLKTPP
jgi:predicted nucleic acid-binding protein